MSFSEISVEKGRNKDEISIKLFFYMKIFDPYFHGVVKKQAIFDPFKDIAFLLPVF